jgi:hypothetical protein
VAREVGAGRRRGVVGTVVEGSVDCGGRERYGVN